MTSASDLSIRERGEPFLRGLIDSVVLLLVLRAAEPLFFGAGFYSTLAIHPYWIVIILAAMQNGFFVGVAAAVAAALLMDWPARPVGVDITAYYMEIAVLPVQWLLAAIVIGTFRQGQVRREGDLSHENARLRQISEDLAAEIDRLDAEIAALELAAAAGRAPDAEAEACAPPSKVTKIPNDAGSDAKRNDNTKGVSPNVTPTPEVLEGRVVS